MWPARCVLLAECTVQVTQGSTCARVENPSDREVCFFYMREWRHGCLHVWFGVRQEGVIPCRMVPSIRDEVHVQLHDITGEVQRARLIIAAQVREVRVAVLDAQLNLNELIRNEKKQTSLSGGHDFPGQG